ncbi:uncharacterized protein LOC116307281 [Actinia tenebrosa]|uniref:Uncharacterized protein LOC116307281 n=1 Tax=Actinia tenebrosa TaxID=6105 RepID=A0A6P8J8F4_ACTTE|nr:uncharacterized protein LOC116307281 [Actinia tenebrosa]
MVFFIKILIFALLMAVVPFVQIAKGQARFTEVPPSMLYVSVGKTARFVWDYTVDNRKNDFQEFSPIWSFYWPNNSESIIGYELVFKQRQWTINHKTCPKQFFSPTRVSLESNATLVIQNVTVGDSGTYGCSLVLTKTDPIRSKVKLVVTSKLLTT